MRFRTCEVEIGGMHCRRQAVCEITTVCVHEHIEVTLACLQCTKCARRGGLYCTPCDDKGYRCWTQLVCETLAVVAS